MRDKYNILVNLRFASHIERIPFQPSLQIINRQIGEMRWAGDGEKMLLNNINNIYEYWEKRWCRLEVEAITLKRVKIKINWDASPFSISLCYLVQCIVQAGQQHTSHPLHILPCFSLYMSHHLLFLILFCITMLLTCRGGVSNKWLNRRPHINRRQ